MSKLKTAGTRYLIRYTPPNNLLLRGTVVTADGQTLRTCYTYDDMGRKISETQPKGTGSSCP